MAKKLLILIICIMPIIQTANGGFYASVSSGINLSRVSSKKIILAERDIKNFKQKVNDKYKQLINYFNDTTLWQDHELIPQSIYDPASGDFIPYIDQSIWGAAQDGCFGIGTEQSEQNCISQITIELKNYRNKIEDCFPKKEGFTVSEFKDQIKINGRKISFYPVTLKNDEYNYKATVLKGSGQGPGETNDFWEIANYSFGNSQSLEKAITSKTLEGANNILIALNNISTTFNQKVSTSSTHRTNAIFGLSFGYDDYSIKAENYFGFYKGIELSANFVMKEKIKKELEFSTKNIAILPFFGIAAKCGIQAYILAGPQIAMRKIKSEHMSLDNNKIEYNIGVGINYELTNDMNIGVRLIHTIKSPVSTINLSKTELIELKNKSSKIMLHFTYRFD